MKASEIRALMDKIRNTGGVVQTRLISPNIYKVLEKMHKENKLTEEFIPKPEFMQEYEEALAQLENKLK